MKVAPSKSALPACESLSCSSLHVELVSSRSLPTMSKAGDSPRPAGEILLKYFLPNKVHQNFPGFAPLPSFPSPISLLPFVMNNRKQNERGAKEKKSTCNLYFLWTFLPTVLWMNREEMSSGDLKIYKEKSEILKLYSIFGKWLHIVGIDRSRHLLWLFCKAKWLQSSLQGKENLCRIPLSATFFCTAL